MNTEQFELFPFSKFSQGFFNNQDENLYIIGVGYDDNPIQNKPNSLNIRSYYTLHWILRGKLHVSVNGKSYTLTQNSLLALTPNTVFKYYPDEKDSCAYIFFEFNGKMASTYTNIGSNKKPFCQFSPPQHLFFLFENYFLRSKQYNRIDYYETLSAFYALVSAFLSPPDSSQKNQDLISNIKFYIKTHILDPDFSLERVIGITHFSHSHLCKLFKQKTGITLVSYIQNQKLKSAKHLLSTTNLPVLHISELLGFSSDAYFFSVFKKTFNITPLQYRKKTNTLLKQ